MVEFIQEKITNLETKRDTLSKALTDRRIAKDRELGGPGRFNQARDPTSIQISLNLDRTLRELRTAKDLRTEIGTQTVERKEQIRVFESRRQRQEAGIRSQFIRSQIKEARAKKLSQALRLKARKLGLEPIRVKGIQRFRDIRTKKIITRLPTIKIKRIIPTRITPTPKKIFTFKETPIKKELSDKEIGEILKISVDPSLSFFNKKRLNEEARITKNIDNFSKQQSNFLQNKIDRGEISVEEANKILKKNVDNKLDDLVSKNEFFKSNGEREGTLTQLGFIYETERLKAVKRGGTLGKIQAGQNRFLRNIVDTPSSFVEAGKGIKKIIDNPASFIPLVSGLRASITKNNLILKSNKIKNFVITRPGEAVAEVGGTILVFGVVSKGLRLVGQLSKPASRQVIKSLKINVGLRSGLKGIASVSVGVPPKVVKALGVGKPVRLPKLSKEFSKAFKETIKSSKVTKRIIKVKKAKKIIVQTTKLVAKRTATARALRRLKQKRIKAKIFRQKSIILKRTKKRRKERIARRKKLLREKKIKERQKRLEKTKLFRDVQKAKAITKRTAKLVAKRTATARALRRLKKKRLETKKKKEIVRIRKLTFKRRRIRLAKRKKLIKEQKFKKSKLGKLQERSRITISRLNKRVKELQAIEELPPGTLRRIKLQTKKVIAKIRQRNVKIKDIKKLTSIQKASLKRFKKTRKKEIKRIQAQTIKPKQVIKRARRRENLRREQRNLGRKIKKLSEPSSIQKASLRRLKALERKRVVRPRPQLAIISRREEILRRLNERIKGLTPQRRQELKRRLAKVMKKIEEKRFKINNELLRQTKLTSIQKISLRRFNQKTKKLESKNKKLGKEIKVIANKEKQIIKSKIKPKLKQKRLLVLRQKQAQAIKSKRIVQRSLVKSISKTTQLVTLGFLNRQKSKTKQAQLIAQPGRLTSAQAQRITTAQVQGFSSAQAQAFAEKLGIGDGITRLKLATLKKRILFKLGKKRKVKKKRIKKVQIGYNVFGKSRGKFIKLNKIPLNKKDALSRGSFAIDKSTARTFEIRKVKGKVKKFGSIKKKEKSYIKKARPKLRGFRKRKGKRVALKNKFIEKKKFLIDSRGEKKQLSLSRLAKREGFRKRPKRKIKSSVRKRSRLKPKTSIRRRSRSKPKTSIRRSRSKPKIKSTARRRRKNNGGFSFFS